MRGRISALRILTWIGIGLGWTVPGWAGTGRDGLHELAELEPVVVTGSLIPGVSDKSPPSRTVIPQDEIESSKAIGVTEILRQVPGLHIDQAGGRGGVSSVYLRGGDPNTTLVLMDGVRINDPTNSRGGSFDFATLNVDAIERIEVVHGALSSLYGSDAMNGAIQIFTRRGQREPVTRLEASGGRTGQYRGLIETRGTAAGSNYALSGSFTDGGEPVEGSGFRGKNLTARLGRSFPDTTRFSATMRFAESRLNSFPDDSGGPKFAVVRDPERRDADERTFGIELSRRILSRWEAELGAGLLDREERIDSPGVAPGIRDPFGIPPSLVNNRFRRRHLRWVNSGSSDAGLRWAAGLEVRSENGTSRGSLRIGGTEIPTEFELRRNLWAPFAEIHHGRPGGLELEAGARIDHPDEFDPSFNPRASLAYTVRPAKIRVWLAGGKGYKLPSLFALGHPLIGNPNLDPEESRTFEAGLEHESVTGRVRPRLVFFLHRFENMIDFEEGPPPRLVNRSEVTARGAEASVRIRPADRLSISPHLTYVKTDIQETAEALRNRPEWRGGIAIHWNPRAAWTVYSDWLYVGRVRDSSIPTGDLRLDPYNRLDLAAAWKPGRAWEYFVAVDNLLNARYEEAVGFSSPGISPRVGVRASF